MGTEYFLHLCRENVTKYALKHLDLKDEDIKIFVYVVWTCKTLQNNKALLITSLADGMYYECTYNGDKKELYIDVYKKFENKCIKVEE